MFLEVSKKKYQKMKELLDKEGIAYTIADNAITKDDLEAYRFQFTKENNPELAAKIYTIYLQASKEVNQPVRRQKWNERYHTLAEEAMGYMTGKNTEETLEYGG